MARPSIRCCSHCGRDTRNKSGICTRCFNGGSGPSEQLERPRLPVPHGDTPFDLVEPADSDDPAAAYHGSTLRDDL